MVCLRNICINTLQKGAKMIIIMSNIPGKHEVREVQKTAILGTAHIIRKVLM
jgi:ribosomal protein L30E